MFERCAQDLLIEIYPGLSPIPGGTDWGRDADLHKGDEEVASRLLVTKSRDYSAVRSNMISGLNSLKKHEVPFDRVILANPGQLSETHRGKLRDEAADLGARLDAVYDRGFFASRLRRDGEWRRRLLGLSGDPISVSRVPWQLAESPWSQLPLVGRAAELTELIDSVGDVIVVGRPGVGKSRFLASLQNVLFVESVGPKERLADDIRWLTPEYLVVDDAGQATELADYLQRLRRQEADWLSVKLILVCWPDEVESVRDLAPGATELHLDLLERSEINAIVEAMGISSVIARQEILDQAEGRPGWAVALADLLLRTGWEELMTGRALLGKVDGYLRRSQLTVNARDLLATVAVLRGVEEADVGKVAATVGVSRPEAGRLLRAVAHGGLLDINSRRYTSSGTRSYTVRPPMLSEALATEHYFLGEVPLGEIGELHNQWGDRSVDLAISVCTAARLGATRARETVDAVVAGVLSDAELRPHQNRLVLDAFLRVDQRAGKSVVANLRAEFDAIDDERRADSDDLASMVSTAYVAAVRYSDRDAVELLLDIAVFEPRKNNPRSGQALSKLVDLTSRVLPDLPSTADHRVFVGEALEQWLPDNPTEDEWRVWLTVEEAVLTPHARGAYTAPEDVRRYILIETVVSPADALVILERLWPPVLGRLEHAPSSMRPEMASTISSWLRVGGGYDHPFGNDHPDDAIARAAEVGRKMLEDLADQAKGQRGLTARLRATAEQFDLTLPDGLDNDGDADPFFRDFDRKEDWRAALEELKADIGEVIQGWSPEPAEVVAQLVTLRDDLRAADINWPDRVSLACQILADEVDNSAAYVERALRSDLFPEAAPFVKELLSAGRVEMDLIAECLAHPSARGVTLAALLESDPADELLRIAVGELQPRDFRLLDMLALREDLSLRVQKAILDDADSGTRGAFAVAVAGRREDPGDSIEGQLWDSWLAAVLEMDPIQLSSAADHQVGHVMSFLALTEPDVLEELVRRRLCQAEPGGYETLGQPGWDSLHLLPDENKRSLFTEFESSAFQSLLLEHLVGSEVDWLEALLDAGVIRPEGALGLHRFDGGPPLDELARVLIPRGVEPERVAGLAFSGSWTGEESERYQALIDRFKEFTESDDESVATVGVAGVEIFGRAHAEALAKEKDRRIRG